MAFRRRGLESKQEEEQLLADESVDVELVKVAPSHTDAGSGRLPLQNPTLLWLEGLRGQPFWPRGSFDWEQALLKVAAEAEKEWSRLSPGLALQRDWLVQPLMEEGAWHENAEKCPQTKHALMQIPLGLGCSFCHAYFSLMHPGKVIAPHCGASNAKLRGQLVLRAGNDSMGSSVGGLCVAGETRPWEEGSMLIFDDSFEHMATLPISCSDRVVLVFDFWHPDLTESMKREVLTCFPSPAQLSGTLPPRETAASRSFTAVLGKGQGCVQTLVNVLDYHDVARLIATSTMMCKQDLWRILCLRDIPTIRLDGSEKSWQRLYQSYLRETEVLLMPLSVENKPMVESITKVLLVGDSGVGKSCFLARLVDGVFVQAFLCTIGVDFRMLLARVRGRWTKVQVWDTAGPERLCPPALFRTITRAYYRNANCILLCFALNDRCSFENLPRWLSEVRSHADDRSKIILVGLKKDLAEVNEQLQQDAEMFAEAEGMTFLAASSKTGENVDEVMRTGLRQLGPNLGVPLSAPPRPAAPPPVSVRSFCALQ